MTSLQNNVILKIDHVSRSFAELHVLSDINLELKEGEIISLIGKSGSGKSTLFNIVSGLLKADKGKIILENEDITGETGHVSYMLQKDLLMPHLKIIDNVSIPLRIQGKNKMEARMEAKEYFEEFGLDGIEELYPSQISGGMKQRVALLRTYLFSKKVSLLDEPFSALDTITKTQIHKWYLEIMKKINLSTIFITHDIDEAIKLSNRVYILSGTPATITDEFIIDKTCDIDEFVLSNEFLEYKRKIIKAIE